MFRQTCVLRRSATSLESDGSRLEVIEMEDRRAASSSQLAAAAAAARRAPATSAQALLAPVQVDASKSQLIVHCDEATSGVSHNNGIQSDVIAASRDTMMFDVV